MTYTLFLILILIVAVLLVLLIMVQNPKGGGLSSSFGGGGSQSIGGVQSTNNFLEQSDLDISYCIDGAYLAFQLCSSKRKPIE